MARKVDFFSHCSLKRRLNKQSECTVGLDILSRKCPEVDY